MEVSCHGGNMVATVDYHSSGGYENLREANPVGGVETMAMPQKDDTIEAIKRLDALFKYAVMHGDEEEAQRICEELRKLTDEV